VRRRDSNPLFSTSPVTLPAECCACSTTPRQVPVFPGCRTAIPCCQAVLFAARHPSLLWWRNTLASQVERVTPRQRWGRDSNPQSSCTESNPSRVLYL
jgi:hypothetical protein